MRIKFFYLLILWFSLNSVVAMACQCFSFSPAEAQARSDLAFTGKVIRTKFSDTVIYYTFRVDTVFKGKNADTLYIYSSSTNCGSHFQLNKTYLVYAREGATSLCSGNELLAEPEKETARLRFRFEPEFAATIGKTTAPLLTHNEAVYLDTDVKSKPADFSFQHKRVGFIYTEQAVTKQEYFAQWGGRLTVSEVFVLSDAEKQQLGGYDAIVVAWPTGGITKAFRQRALRRVKRLSV
jgi:hypothetical protein